MLFAVVQNVDLEVLVTVLAGSGLCYDIVEDELAFQYPAGDIGYGVACRPG